MDILTDDAGIVIQAQTGSLRPPLAHSDIFISASGEYLPGGIVDNGYFSKLTGRPREWFEQLTGIRSRRRAQAGENTNSMAIAAIENMLSGRSELLAGVDLIIGASYTPWDTIGTMAHVVQRHFNLAGAKAIYVSTACSSFIDSLEMAAAYIETGRASKALVVAAEHNSLYSSDADEKSGHLWGDGAAAVLLQASSANAPLQIVDVFSRGLANIGSGPTAIRLLPQGGGLTMSNGREVFAHAVREMVAATRLLVERNGLAVSDLRLFIPHQANKRILDKVASDLGLLEDRLAVTIGELGNTGCASVAVAFHRYWEQLQPGEYAALITFGGGYSIGAALLQRVV
jgi:3-oxoacyl-[acyl-carrier-protein] synthase-3